MQELNVNNLFKTSIYKRIYIQNHIGKGDYMNDLKLYLWIMKVLTSITSNIEN